MSGVVLRCPTCGTTQGETGECDACLEAEVRYFCGNHRPGLWLDEPVCKECGARFGDAPARRPEPPPRAAPTRRAREPRRPEFRPPISRDAEPPRTGRRRPPPGGADPGDTPATPSLADLLAHISEERERARYRVEEAPPWEPAAEAPRRSIPVAGCLVRLVLFVLLLIALAIGGLFVLMGGG